MAGITLLQKLYLWQKK